MGILDINNADMSWEETLTSLGFGYGTKFGAYIDGQWVLNQPFPGVMDFSMFDKTLSGELYIKEKLPIGAKLSDIYRGKLQLHVKVESFMYTINTPAELISIVNMLKGKVKS